MLLVGIAYNMRRILLLKPEARWIEAFRTNQPGLSLQDPPQIIAPVASVLTARDRRGRQSLSALSLRYLLDSISSRLDESRDIARYFTGLLIFLGLLGTFWGLLDHDGDDRRRHRRAAADRRRPRRHLRGHEAGPGRTLQGMGTAFSASLFGLAGSLVLGFLDLQATQAQNAFYNDLEEWLSSLTRLGAIDGPHMGEPGGGRRRCPAMSRRCCSRPARISSGSSAASAGPRRVAAGSTRRWRRWSQHLGALGDRMGREQELLQRLAQSQELIAERLSRRVDDGVAAGPVLDEATRSHIRNTDLSSAGWSRSWAAAARR